MLFKNNNGSVIMTKKYNIFICIHCHRIVSVMDSGGFVYFDDTTNRRSRQGCCRKMRGDDTPFIDRLLQLKIKL